MPSIDATPGLIEVENPEHHPVTSEQSAEADAPFVISNDEAACRALITSGPGILALRRNDEEKVRATLMPALPPFKKPDVSYRVGNKFRFVVTVT